MGFEVDFSGSDIENLTRDAANDAIQDVAGGFQREMDRLLRSHGGRPVDEVKPAMRMALLRVDITVDDGEVQEWSEAISEGTRIVVEVE